jgi:hypothetical protein
MESESFWSIIAQTAATLAGFTLAGFSIYMATTDRADSDEICRRYGFTENSSRASWAFVYLILMLFSVPLLLSILKLWGFYTLPPSAFSFYRGVSGVLALSFLSISFILACIQVAYFFKLAEASARQEEFLIERGVKEKKSRNPFNNLAPQKIKCLKIGFFLVVIGITLFVLSLNVRNTIKTAWEINFISSPLLEKLELVSPGSLAIFSMVWALVWIYFHFHLFRPDRLLFVVKDSDKQEIKRFHQGLKDTCEQIKEMQGLLLPIVASPSEQLLRGMVFDEHVQMQKVKKRFDDLEDRLTGWSWNAAIGERERRTDKLDYHLTTLNFCLDQDFMRFGAIKLLFNELEYYDRGLDELSHELSRTWEEFKELSRFIQIQEGSFIKPTPQQFTAGRKAAVDSNN